MKVIFVHNKFDRKNKGTWMAPFIRAFLSLDNYNTGDAPVYYNHCAILDNDNNVIEAGWNKVKKKGEVIITPYLIWQKGRCFETYKTFDAVIEIDPKTFIGVPYGFKTILWHIARNICRKKWWFGTRCQETFICSSLAAYCMGLDKWYEYDTEDLYLYFKTNQNIY